MYCVKCGAKLDNLKGICLICEDPIAKLYIGIDNDEAKVTVLEHLENIDKVATNFYYEIPKGRMLVIDPEILMNENVSHIYELFELLGMEDKTL